MPEPRPGTPLNKQLKWCFWELRLSGFKFARVPSEGLKPTSHFSDGRFEENSTTFNLSSRIPNSVSKRSVAEHHHDDVGAQVSDVGLKVTMKASYMLFYFLLMVS